MKPDPRQMAHENGQRARIDRLVAACKAKDDLIASLQKQLKADDADLDAIERAIKAGAYLDINAGNKNQFMCVEDGKKITIGDTPADACRKWLEQNGQEPAERVADDSNTMEVTSNSTCYRTLHIQREDGLKVLVGGVDWEEKATLLEKENAALRREIDDIRRQRGGARKELCVATCNQVQDRTPYSMAKLLYGPAEAERLFPKEVPNETK